ncbi:hypothetical protein, partial [Phascolarctobacterium succinatutens]|uniref:hypothetical protein n=1 Tax=Phascolarctobacterium succinatutens TaxID=626940 RepID=UPI00307B0483
SFTSFTPQLYISMAINFPVNFLGCMCKTPHVYNYNNTKPVQAQGADLPETIYSVYLIQL